MSWARGGLIRMKPKSKKFSLVTVEPRKLEHGFRRIRARIPYTLP